MKIDENKVKKIKYEIRKSVKLFHQQICQNILLRNSKLDINLNCSKELPKGSRKKGSFLSGRATKRGGGYRP